jgi:hypothetical protein
MKFVAEEGVVETEGLRVAPKDLERVTGWKLDPQGLCRGDVCVLLAGRDVTVDGGAVDLVALADVLGAPLAVDEEAGAAVFGIPAEVRAADCTGMHVDDFIARDLDGATMRWSSLGRKKKLLFAWASW